MDNNIALKNKINALKAYALYPQHEIMDIHINLNINPRITEQMFVQKFSFPHMIHRNVTVLAFTSDLSKKEELIKAGADYIADEEIINQIKKGKIFFDYCVASPDMMKILSPLAKVLGPRGLMPNVKLGTLDTNLNEAIKRLKQGQLSLRNDKFGILHVPIGKLTESTSLLIENIEALIHFVNSKKPVSVKGNYIKSCFISSTEGPSLSI